MKILICDYGLPFDLNTPYFKPLGGSEISILLLSKGLAELGHSVVLLNTNNYTEQDKNIILRNKNEMIIFIILWNMFEVQTLRTTY